MIAAADGCEAAAFAVGDVLTGSHGTVSANRRPIAALHDSVVIQTGADFWSAPVCFHPNQMPEKLVFCLHMG